MLGVVSLKSILSGIQDRDIDMMPPDTSVTKQSIVRKKRERMYDQTDMYYTMLQ